MHVEPSGAPVVPADQVVLVGGVFGNEDLHEGSVTLQQDEADRRSRGWRMRRVAARCSCAVIASSNLAFGQRVFAQISPAEWPDAIVALRGFPRQRMLSLALEAGGVRKAAIYALAVRRASQISTRRPNRAFWALAQLQSALAQVLRMLKVGTLDASAGEALVASLSCGSARRRRPLCGRDGAVGGT